MKEKLKAILLNAVESACQKGALPSPEVPEIEIEEPKISAHGDYSSNLAMKMASPQKMAPRKIAEALLANLPENDIVEKSEIAGPGFINFLIRKSAWHPLLETIHQEDTHFGTSTLGRGKKVQVEFVSANPTGPLHVGHGRGAAVGDAVANILSCCGYDVQREYYVNDSGRQIRTLGLSVYLRYRELCGQQEPFPDDCYQGEYIRELAAEIKAEKADGLLAKDKEDAVLFCARHAAANILAGIEADLDAFGVHFDRWYSEQSLFDCGKVGTVMENLEKRGILYQAEGAKWFQTTRYGDEKDRVVVRENGLTTYFASDIAYHQDKFDRGFDQVIDVWGADHHGYIPRVAAAVQAFGHDRDQFHVILVQLVSLLREGEPVAMSTRSGEFVTLRDVVDEVGRDAARFIFLTRHYESPLDFDLGLAKKQTNENPVFYVQYVHARIASILRKAKEEQGITPPDNGRDGSLERLEAPEELQMMKRLGRYPDVVASGAELLEPHRITFYLMDLASAFHSYYNKHKVLTEDQSLTRARLYLVLAVQKVIRNGLTLLGVSAPETM